jgi:hypothetical protein
MNWTRLTKEAWTDEIANSDFDVVGTLKFTDGRKVSEDKAALLWGAYWHKIDRIVFGHAADKRWGVNRLCFDELGEYESNRHLHFVAQAPIDTELFCAVLNAVWEGFCADAAALRFNHVTPIRSKRDAGAYIVKETGNQNARFAGLKCSHRNTDRLAYEGVSGEKVLNRLQNRVTNTRLSAAMDMLRLHIDDESRRKAIRLMR